MRQLQADLAGQHAAAVLLALLRARRERERELKAAHRAQREGFVSALAELELDALECWLAPSEWYERGEEAAGVDALLKAAP